MLLRNPFAATNISFELIVGAIVDAFYMTAAVFLWRGRLRYQTIDDLDFGT